MALETLTLPKCDVCGEIWLPQKGPARDDPRAYDAAQRILGLPGIRCGKCKSPGWDREYTGDRRRKNPLLPAQIEEEGEGSFTDELVPAIRCNHGLLHCPQCPSG